MCICHAFRGCETKSDAAEQQEELTLYNEAFLCCVWQRESAGAQHQ